MDRLAQPAVARVNCNFSGQLIQKYGTYNHDMAMLLLPSPHVHTHRHPCKLPSLPQPPQSSQLNASRHFFEHNEVHRIDHKCPAKRRAHTSETPTTAVLSSHLASHG